jgi:hypothetical protein
VPRYFRVSQDTVYKEAIPVHGQLLWQRATFPPADQLTPDVLLEWSSDIQMAFGDKFYFPRNVFFHDVRILLTTSPHAHFTIP